MWKTASRIITRNSFHVLMQPCLPNISNYSASIINQCVCQYSSYSPGFMMNRRNLLHLSALTKSKVTIYMVDRHGKKHKAEATVGDSLLDVIIDNDFNFETYGVCEGTISCSTCHVILDPDTYAEMEDPLMDELDMLDLACGLTETSRLGCQVYVTKEMDGIIVRLPAEITDARDL